MTNDEITTIQLRKSTRDALKRYGHKDETLDEIIALLLAKAQSEGSDKCMMADGMYCKEGKCMAWKDCKKRGI